MQRGRPSLLGSLLLCLASTWFSLLTTGCLFSPYVTGIVHESSEGSVFLDEVPDLAFEASHPVSLDPAILTHSLRGVSIRKEGVVDVRSGSTKPVVRHAFSNDDATFLAPLLADALTVAGRGDQVVFRLVHSTKSTPLATAGTLYVHRGTLYLTLTHYNYKPVDPEILYTRKPSLPYSSVLTRRRVGFSPKGLGQPTDEKPPGAPAHPTLTTLAIDYNRLAETVPAHPELQPGKPSPRPAQRQVDGKNGSAPTSHAANDELQKAKRLVSKKEAELKALEERLRLLQKRMAQKERLIKKLKNKTKKIKRKKKKRAAKRK